MALDNETEQRNGDYFERLLEQARTRLLDLCSEYDPDKIGAESSLSEEGACL
jgi:hypothetical protein